MNYKTDILIIGSGPVGIFSAYQAGFLGMKTIVVDALDTLGGQLNALYPNKYIYDIPGFRKILAKDLIDNLVDQASQFNPEYLSSRFITDMSKNEETQTFTVKTSKEDTIETKAIIIAAGAGAFGPNRPPIAGIEEYENKSIHYFVKDTAPFKDKNVVIAGGGDSAVDWALMLCDLAKKTYVVHRRNNFRAAQSSIDQMHKKVEEGKIELVIPYQLKDVAGENGYLSKITLSTLDGETKEVEADHLLAFFGLARSLGSLEEWGLNINKTLSSIDVSLPTCETNINGIYAVGDISHYDHKLKLISVGFSEASMALHDAWKYVFPDKAFHFVHSTSK